MTYVPPDPLPFAALAMPLTQAEDALARLDERLAKSPMREGFVSRDGRSYRLSVAPEALAS